MLEVVEIIQARDVIPKGHALEDVPSCSPLLITISVTMTIERVRCRLTLQRLFQTNTYQLVPRSFYTTDDCSSYERRDRRGEVILFDVTNLIANCPNCRVRNELTIRNLDVFI